MSFDKKLFALLNRKIKETPTGGGVSQAYVDDGDLDTLNRSKSYAESIVKGEHLLRNPTLTINQRAISSVTIGANFSHVVDGWFSARSVIEVVDDGIMFAWNGSDGSEGYIQQKVETADLFGEEVTISAKIDGVWKTGTVVVPERSGETVYEDIGDGFSVGAANWGDYVSFSLFTKNTTPAHIGAIKSEIGNIATPFVPPDPATELLKCQRYYCYIGTYVRTRAAAVTTNFIDFTLNVPQMRTVPSIVGTLTVDTLQSATAQEGFTFEVIKNAPNGTLIRATKTAHGLTEAAIGTTTGAALSAEL